MAQANVAREPSMEEILASIRKIIESNDPAEEQSTPSQQTAAVGSQHSQQEAVDPALSLLNGLSEAVGDEEPAEKSGLSVGDDMSKEPTLHPGTPFFATPLRTGSADDQSAGEPDRDTSASETPTSDGAPDRPVSLARLAAEVAEERVERGFSDTASNGGASDVVVLPAANDRPEPRDEFSSFDTKFPRSSDPSTENRPAEEPRALMSPDAGSQVATSFGNLNHAVSNGPTRSFDEIAEDMLRPMLQEWLDDNLPTLVERLVREEIERVARGG